MVDRIVWPAYFNMEKTRREGRRVPVDLAVSEPSVDEIAKAIQQVGYDTVIEREVAYPREPWVESGRVRVKNADDAAKNDLVQAAAAYIVALRD